MYFPEMSVRRAYAIHVKQEIPLVACLCILNQWYERWFEKWFQSNISMHHIILFSP